MKNIFVYGTLKRGFQNYSEQYLGRFYIGNYTTQKPYSLVVADQYYVPVLLLNTIKHNQEHIKGIKGELYRVNQDTLAWLDVLEGVGKDKGYQRVKIDVLSADGKVIMAEAYMKYRQDLAVIHNELSTQYELDSRYIPLSLRGLAL
ncbi:MAG: gamma-glutamylcyclotransferase [Cocleimonas sp.]|nr:gamma-glutamylcyclotransferase [Cocleimonas sp.]